MFVLKKVISLEQAMSHIKDGMTIMVGGFLGTGTPHLLVDEIEKRGFKNLTIIANDTSFVDNGVGKLVVNNQVSKVIASHIGTNAETGRKMNANEMEVELVPQGTLAERVRAGGTGLGGILTATGLGTLVEEGKQKIVIDNKEYLIETPLRADVALIAGELVDEKGNIVYDKAARNFNPLMAMAADVVIVEAVNLVKAGEIDPDRVVTPGIVVDFIVKGE